MKEGKIRKGLRLYRTVITKNIVLFMAVGIINIFFSDSGFFPNAQMQQLTEIIYGIALPLVASYMAGKIWGDEIGAMAGVIAVSGILSSDCGAMFIGAVCISSLVGWVASRGYDKFRDRVPPSGAMLGRNLWIIAMGVAGAFLGNLFLVPALNVVSQNILWFLLWLEKNRMMFLSGLFIEPLKLLYLNNDLNHGLLIPLGMEQVQQRGSSMLFLLETNPGPGLGVLFAVFLCQKQRKKEMKSAIFAQAAGGIHEIYFPVVLADLRLTIPLIAGGMAGTTWCSVAKGGLVGPISPGSILTILLMAKPGSHLQILAAILLSAAVSCVVAVGILQLSKRGVKEESVQEQEDTPSNQPLTIPAAEPITRIYVVCSAGLGSSAMGASLFRRTLKGMGIGAIKVAAASADQIPEDAQLILCQKEYMRKLSQQSIPVISVENLMDQSVYENIINQLREEGRIL